MAPSEPPSLRPPPTADPGRPVATDTLIVGASAAGLSVAACLVKQKQGFLILEQAADVGATWRGHYDRLRLHTPRRLSGLPHHPFPASFSRYPSRDDVVAYLQQYAAAFDLRPLFGREVVSIRQEHAGARWVVRTRDAAVFHARHVVMATGLAHRPHLPRWPSQERFGGEILHSSQYRNGQPWRGRDVLVVGIGNSGGEIALDLWEQGARPAISVRGALNVVPRDFLGVSAAGWSILFQSLPAFIGEGISAMVSRRQFAPLRKLGLAKLPHGPLTQSRDLGRIPLVDVGTVARLSRGEIGLRPAIKGFSPGKVEFTDGRTDAFDAVVLATGYRPGLGALLEPEITQQLLDDGRPRGSGEEIAPGLYLCGFRVTPTGTLREIGREARRIAENIRRQG